MGFWLDMVFGKSPLQSELDTAHRKMDADRKTIAKHEEALQEQLTFNENVETALKEMGNYNEDHAKFALAVSSEFDELKKRVDLLEANVTVHKGRSKRAFNYGQTSQK